MAKKSKDKQVTHIEKDDLKARQAAINEAIKVIEKEYGKGAIMDISSENPIKVEAVSSGSLAIDSALGIGGYPKGRIVEVYGPESSGKTTIALHAIAEVQKTGGIAAFIDAENALDIEYAKALGVDFTPGKFFLSQPDSGEQALDIAEKLILSGAIDIIVIDSVAALVPKAEIDGVMGANHIGLQARLMSQALRKLTGQINKANTIALFINQLREKVGVMFGSPEVTTGGRALKFYSTVRIDVRKGEAIKGADSEILGNRTKIKIVKNKVAPPFKVAEVDIMFGEGISKIGETLDFAVDLDIINKSGSWFSYNGERLGQGRENVKKVFEENEELYNEIYGLVRDEIMSKTGKKNNSVDEEESNDNIDELDLGIETLGEVE
ncbi:recombinase RecA [Gemella haemolysans]|jgi:RecA protein|uniref:Protein RecA n=4 Tax=Gemella TaxID=1378 RepID=A0A133ZVC5_9BACL|nr:recombinase RecA [Gemella haemolysans]TKW63987.1 MAG: recombinase RecA [Gemella sp.]EER68060.1 RecA protein [Gemella haemolysans ATCC 10379]KAA8709379.1 recombinase RecA [Gemella haemolysans]KXB59384.1 RecA protein [Gemella haemolysans]MBS5318307.1 recombinase RecA [Gemella haemolysans]